MLGSIKHRVVGLLFITIAALLGCLSTQPVSAERLSKTLSKSEAEQLVIYYLRDQGLDVKSPHFELDAIPQKDNSSAFFFFQAYFNNDARLNSLGSYAVNRGTAELWERILCEKLKSKSVQNLQDKARKEKGLKEPSDSAGSSDSACL